jgi:hypothetical protein
MGIRREFRCYCCDFDGGSAPYGKSGLTARGTVCYTLGQREVWDEPNFEKFCGEWDPKHSYKLGVLARPGQVIRVTYGARGGGEIELRQDAAVTAELDAIFGPGWTGFVPATTAARAFKFEKPNLATFPITVSIDPAEAKPQPIPIVARHRTGTFASGFMPGLWVIPPAAGKR